MSCVYEYADDVCLPTSGRNSTRRRRRVQLSVVLLAGGNTLFLAQMFQYMYMESDVYERVYRCDVNAT